jgi:hypothetical protein
MWHAQTINVTLNNVNGATGVTSPMGVLIGDVNGDRVGERGRRLAGTQPLRPGD